MLQVRSGRPPKKHNKKNPNHLPTGHLWPWRSDAVSDFTGHSGCGRPCHSRAPGREWNQLARVLVPPFIDGNTQEVKTDSWSQGLGRIVQGQRGQPLAFRKDHTKTRPGQGARNLCLKASLWKNLHYFYTPFLPGNEIWAFVCLFVLVFFNDLQKFSYILDNKLHLLLVLQTFSPSLFLVWYLLQVVNHSYNFFFFFFFFVIVGLFESHAQMLLLNPTCFIRHPPKVSLSSRITLHSCTYESEQGSHNTI